MTNLHAGSLPIVSFVDYVVGARAGRYCARSSTIYQAKTMSGNSADYFMEEVARAAARQLVQKVFDPPIMTNQPSHSINGQEQQDYWFWDDKDNIFALGAYVCHKCLTLKPFKICFVEGNEKGSKRELFYACDPYLLNNTRGIRNINEHISVFHRQVPAFLRQLVITWSENKGENYLIGLQIPDTANRSSIELTFKAGPGVNKTIAVPYYEDQRRQIDLLPRTITEQDQHWASRVASHNQISLCDEELLDFLATLNNRTTFGFFKVIWKDESEARTYLMAITKTPQSRLRLTK